MKAFAKTLTYLLSCTIIAAGVQGPVSLNAQTLDNPMLVNAGLPQTDGRAALAQGKAQLKRGNADQALVSLEQALKLYTQANDPKGIAASRDALGDLYSRQGQYAVALVHYQEANKSFTAANDSYNANLMLAKTGDMYYRAGDVTAARTAFSQMSVTQLDTSAAGTAKDVQSKASKGSSIFGKARSIASGGPSLSTASDAASIGADVKATIDAEKEKYRQYIIYSIYELGLGRLDYSSNQMDSAKTHFSNALSAADNPLYGKFGQARRWRIASRTSLGDIAVVQSRYPDAIKLYTAAVDGARKDNRADLRWPAQRGIGKSKLLVAAQERDPKKSAKVREEAIIAYRDALATIEGIREGSLSADESRSTFLGSTKDVYDEAVAALAERALMTATAGQPLAGPALADASEAFKLVEQSRARSLLDMLGESNINITEGVPADLLKRKQDNLNRQQEIAQEMSGLGGSETGAKKSNSDLEAELNQLATEYDSIENQIRAANPRYSSLTLPQPLTLSEVQQQVLDDKTTLLEYNLGKTESYMWAVTQSGVGLYKLPARSVVEQQALDLRAQLIPATYRTPIAGINLAPTRGLGLSSSAATEPAGPFVSASNTLYKTAVEPAASMIGDKRVLIVADGTLNYVPFEALVTAGGGTDYSALPYMIKTNEIVYAPSASVLGIIRKQAAAKSTGKAVLLIADPVFNASDPRAKGAPATAVAGADTRGLGLSSALTDVAGTPPASSNGAPAQGLTFLRLNGTRTEAEQIALLTKQNGGTADVWLDLNANESNMQAKDLRNYRVVHVATHGLLNAERPQFTGLVLSLVGNKTGDGFLRTDEIFNLKLGAPLVMLSACETGLGKEKRGEGVIGLTRAFMYAGAPTVGVSLWSVSDASTAQLMTDFYKKMLTGTGMAPGAAMREAQMAMIAGKKWSKPFNWAPFVLVGEWR